jgi:hypothetical protein
MNPIKPSLYLPLLFHPAIPQGPAATPHANKFLIYVADPPPFVFGFQLACIATKWSILLVDRQKGVYLM